MRILLGGASGAIGRPLVRALVAAGHDVVGLTRHEDRARAIDAAGARGVVCDVLDYDRVLAIARDAAPDVVVDETTALPQRWNTRRPEAFYADMIPLRLRGTPNLLEAAAAVGARAIFQSIGFLYAPGPPGLRTEEDAPYLDDAPPPWDLALPAITAIEERVTRAGGTVLRYGMFYGPGTHFAPGNQMHEDARRRRLAVIGRGTGVWSFVHTSDAAAATLAAIEREAPGIFNVVDDDPVPMREWVPAFAAAIGAPRPVRVPAFLVRRLAGPLLVHWGTTLAGASNARARTELGWRPGIPGVREGFRTALDRDPAEPPRIARA